MEDWDAVATFANAKIRSINIWYALGRLSYLIYIFQLGHPVGLYTSLTTSSREFRLVNPPNETASPASARHRMTASSDRFNRAVTSRTYTLYLSPSQSNKETKAAVTSLANFYFVVWVEFCFLDFFYYCICHWLEDILSVWITDQIEVVKKRNWQNKLWEAEGSLQNVTDLSVGSKVRSRGSDSSPRLSCEQTNSSLAPRMLLPLSKWTHFLRKRGGGGK